MGPHAGSSEHLLGNYYDAVAGSIVTPLQAFQVDTLIVMPRLPDCTIKAPICMQRTAAHAEAGSWLHRPLASVQLLMFWVLVQNALGVDKVVYMGENFLPDFGADGMIDAATFACKDADACILFMGTSAINPHVIDTASR